MNLNHLKTFLTVAETGSISGAAEILHLSQPAVSKHIRSLEAHFEVQLFERLGRTVELTAAGEVLAGYARQVQQILDRAHQDLAEMAETLQGRLTVGTSTVPGQYLMPYIIKYFREIYPEVKVRLHVGDTSHVLQQLTAGEIEVALVGAPVNDPKIAGFEFAKDELVLIVPAGHPLAERPAVSLTEVLGEPLVWRDRGSGTRKVIEERLQAAGVDLDRLDIALELGTTEAVVNAVEAGLGISFVSRWAIRKHLLLGTLSSPRVRDLSFHRGLYLYYLRSRKQRRVG
ncbi:selenium metabolism-associated LysR family transcriptional regulator, partial [Calderihabitans maritimus]